MTSRSCGFKSRLGYISFSHDYAGLPTREPKKVGSVQASPASGTFLFLVFSVYILYSQAKDRFYIGQSQDVHKRLLRHNAGYVRSTKHGSPWQIVYTEQFQNRREAVKREKYLKSLKSKIKIKELVDASR